MRKLIVITLLTIALPITAIAAIYKYVDENGNTVFADQPGPNSVKIEKRDVQTIKTHKVRPTTTLTNPNKAQNNGSGYSEFKISQPVNDSTVRNDNGNINVELQISPELNQKLNHLVVLLLDGKPVSKPSTETSFTLHGVDRGQHSLSANIVTSGGNVISSTQTITIHLKRFSLSEKTDPSDGDSDGDGDGDGDNNDRDNNQVPDYAPTGAIVSPVKRAPLAPRAPMAPRATQAR